MLAEILNEVKEKAAEASPADRKPGRTQHSRDVPDNRQRTSALWIRNRHHARHHHAQPLLDPEFLARLEQLELVSRKIFLGRMKGERRSKRKGQSVEFADYRNYVVGDDLRFLDWNLYARLDRLFIRLFMEEEDLHFYVLIDNSLSMDFGTPTQAALRQAGRGGARLHRPGQPRPRRDRGVQRPADAEPAGGARPAQPVAAAGFPAEARAGRAERPARVAARRSAIKSSGKGIVVVLSDFMDKGGYEEALRYLVARQMDIYVIQILSQEEIEPEIVGDLKLVDVEDEDEAEITVSGPLLKRYKQNLAAFRAALHEFCTRRGVTLPVHQQPGAVRSAGADLPAAARAGEISAGTMKQTSLTTGSSLLQRFWFPARPGRRCCCLPSRAGLFGLNLFGGEGRSTMAARTDSSSPTTFRCRGGWACCCCWCRCDHPALLPQAEAQAAAGAEHVPVEEEHRGPARQQPVPVAAARTCCCCSNCWPCWC